MKVQKWTLVQIPACSISTHLDIEHNRVSILQYQVKSLGKLSIPKLLTLRADLIIDPSLLIGYAVFLMVAEVDLNGDPTLHVDKLNISPAQDFILLADFAP